ncbi:HD domain-containing protein [Lysobacter brunescens]|uniref:ATP-binding protein n=1 Tax=Lysobacter brunescens TaxID=262323 RepID=A0ABW2Y983_9GAMM
MGIEDQQLWQATLGASGDSNRVARERLKTSFLSFRNRVSKMIQEISTTLPGLTVHDITHVDALWRVAREIAGGDYPINPAEAYVLGGSFLLHDAAHSVAAFPAGLTGIKQTTTWKDLIAQKFQSKEPEQGSEEEKIALFHILRHLHADQAQDLPKASWTDSEGDQAYLIEDSELRSYYGSIIGEIAASHHWPTHIVSNRFSDRILPPPAFLQATDWQIDLLKIALLLRTSDAAHIDALRAPWFLFALKQPSGISRDHWKFQSKLGQPIRNSDGYLIISSGSPFTSSERTAWWLAYDTAQMIDRELRDAYAALRDSGRKVFAAIGVLGSNSPEAFSRQVATKNWAPLNIGPTVGDIPKLIKALGGNALYGDSPKVPIRELIQNAMDAVRALRAIDGIGADEGEVEVGFDPAEEENHTWIRVSDTGIGMSRHVLTNTLLDFGNSLWKSDFLREEIPGLASEGFESVGNFGIGFYSVFMLANHVEVVTRRYERKPGDDSDQWHLIFDDGLSGRPLIMQPDANSKLKRQGTIVSLKVSNEKMARILPGPPYSQKKSELIEVTKELASELICNIAPASDIKIYSRISKERYLVISPDDWKSIPEEDLTRRARSDRRKLHDLYENGKLIGRLGLNQSSFSSEAAAITINGLRCGTAKGLTGVVVAGSNNHDAKRSESSVGGSIESWQQWALDVINNGKNSLDDLERLHPLQPNLDLSIWLKEGKRFTISELKDWIETADVITTHEGQVEHEEYDEIGSFYFDEFEYEDEIICVPSPYQFKDSFPWLLGIAPIKYKSILENIIAEAWGAFETSESEECVGSVRSAEILRTVTKYYRQN